MKKIVLITGAVFLLAAAFLVWSNWPHDVRTMSPTDHADVLTCIDGSGYSVQFEPVTIKSSDGFVQAGTRISSRTNTMIVTAADFFGTTSRTAKYTCHMSKRGGEIEVDFPITSVKVSDNGIAICGTGMFFGNTIRGRQSITIALTDTSPIVQTNAGNVGCLGRYNEYDPILGMVTDSRGTRYAVQSKEPMPVGYLMIGERWGPFYVVTGEIKNPLPEMAGMLGAQNAPIRLLTKL